MKPEEITQGYLETDPEVSAKRTAEMQQLAQPVHGQTGPATRNLTIVWDDEKQAMLERIQALEHRAQTVEQSILANLESIESRLEILEIACEANASDTRSLMEHLKFKTMTTSQNP